MAEEVTLQEDILPQQILQAAMQLYQKHGVKKVTMDDISKAIGKSRTSIYYYYKNRDEIFDAVMDTLINEVIEEISQATNNALTIKDKIKAFCFTKVMTSIERRSLFKAIEVGMDAEEISRHSQVMTELHKRLMQQETSLLKKVLSDGSKNNSTRELKPKESSMLIFIILSGIRGIKREMSYDNDFSKLDYATEILADMAIKWLEK